MIRDGDVCGYWTVAKLHSSIRFEPMKCVCATTAAHTLRLVKDEEG